MLRSSPKKESTAIRLTARFSSPPDWTQYLKLAHVGIYPAHVTQGRTDPAVRLVAVDLSDECAVREAVAVMRKMGATVRIRKNAHTQETRATR